MTVILIKRLINLECLDLYVKKVQNKKSISMSFYEKQILFNCKAKIEF